MLENIARLINALEATGRRVWGLRITHPNGVTGPTVYHLTFYPPIPRNFRQQRYTDDRIWGRDVEKMLTQIATFPLVSPERQD